MIDLNIWYLITLIGSPIIWTGIVGILAITYFLIRKKVKIKTKGKLKNFILLLIPILILTFFGTEILKFVIQSPRVCIPCPAPDCNPYCPTTSSFPSGHTATISSVVMLIFLFLRKKEYLLLFILPILVGISRLMLGVHTSIDIIFGFIFGILIAGLIWIVKEKLIGRKKT